MQLFCKDGIVVAWHDDGQAMPDDAYPGTTPIAYSGLISALDRVGDPPPAGYPDSRPYKAPAVDLSVYAKQRRDVTEAAGITVSGMAVASDTDSQTRVANAYAGMQVTGATSIRFKASAGFLVLTLDQVKAVGSALFAHTQACFDAEDQVDAGLSASPPTITTTDQVDAIFAAVKSAY